MTDPHVIDPGHAPTPFTADEIRRGCPAGRQVTVIHTDANGAAEYWTTKFAKVDEEAALLVNQQVGEDGQPIGDASELTATWDELQAHASFPADSTTISATTLNAPIGELDCLRYEVSDGIAAKTLWFARNLPGLPVKTVYVEEGQNQLTTLVVRDSSAEPPDYSD